MKEKQIIINNIFQKKKKGHPKTANEGDIIIYKNCQTEHTVEYTVRVQPSL